VAQNPAPLPRLVALAACTALMLAIASMRSLSGLRLASQIGEGEELIVRERGEVEG
jgi:hypothetical protein